MFGCLYSERADGGLCLKERDDQGAYVLDRDPTYAAPILEYLKHGRLLMNDTVSPLGLIQEARFFGVDSLIPEIERRTQGFRAPLDRMGVIRALNSVLNRRVSFQDEDLTGADLSLLDLHRVDFRGANLTMCKFEGANLSQRIAVHTDVGANLKDAVMDGSVLFGVNFRDATLTDASLRNCDLRRAELGNADILVRT
ncbi:hypothetical protein HPB50_002023 [Hyalomma asiaticum]|uniref:Uncharacterized protein n=1 Tax=Hyalomma asiaticum TaxID=266040 RepID=A0ACB7T5G7_HYAAI|nr:hypothetical protein HPB50_002023 [Hyalomma asiaticum]